MTDEIKTPCVLIVEGTEEKYFFEALIQHLGLQQARDSKIQICPFQGKTKWRDKLKALTLTYGFSQVVSLGIVRDADSDPCAAFLSVQDALKYVGLPCPPAPMTPVGGHEQPVVNVLILPLDRPGMLEDICLQAVQNDPAMVCVSEYFDCLKEHSVSLFRNMAKAKVQVFLASRPEVKRLGEAALAGYWPWKEDAFNAVNDFLRQLVQQSTRSMFTTQRMR